MFLWMTNVLIFRIVEPSFISVTAFKLQQVILDDSSLFYVTLSLLIIVMCSSCHILCAHMVVNDGFKCSWDFLIGCLGRLDWEFCNSASHNRTAKRRRRSVVKCCHLLSVCSVCIYCFCWDCTWHFRTWDIYFHMAKKRLWYFYF